MPVPGLSYSVVSSLRVTEAGTSQEFGAGSLLFVRKNFLVKFTKQPAPNGSFRAITVLFDSPLLHEFRQQHDVGGELPGEASTAIRLLPIARRWSNLYDQQRTVEAKGGEERRVKWIPDTLEEAKAAGITDPDTLEAVDYYRTPRSYSPYSTNRPLFRSDALLRGFDAFHLVGELLTQPLQVIVAGRLGTTFFFGGGQLRGVCTCLRHKLSSLAGEARPRP